MRRMGFLVALVVVIVAAGGSAGTARADGPVVFRPGSAPYGVHYPRWAARWGRFAFQTPLPRNPLAHPELCGANRDGVRFMSAVGFGTVATIRCTLPEGTPLLFIPGGFVCTGVTDNVFTEQKLAACANAATDQITHLRMRIDGARVSHLRRFRVTSPLVTLHLPSDNLFGVPAQSTPMVLAGFVVMVRPLEEGTHTLVTRDEFGGAVAQLRVKLTIVDA
jgi:hypothetical protein